MHLPAKTLRSAVIGSFAISLLPITSNAQSIFSDTFFGNAGNNQPVNTGIPGSGIRTPTDRQSGGSTISTYTMTGLNVGANISTNDDGKTNNGSGTPTSNEVARIRNNEQTVAGGSNGFFNLDTDFGPSLVGKTYTISFDWYYNKRNTGSTDQWVSFGIGDTPSLTGPNAADTDFGMLIRPAGVGNPNDNLARFYNDSTFSSGNDFAATPNFTLNYVTFSVKVTENALGTAATVDVTAGATSLISGFNIGFDNSTSRHFDFASHLGSDPATPGADFSDLFIDNVSITAVPEPSTVALFMGAGVALMAVVRRRRMAQS